MIKRSLTVAILVASSSLLHSSAVLAQSGARAADVVEQPKTFRMRAEQAAAEGTPFIENFQARPSPDLKPGSQLAVSLRGTPGAEVDLAIQGVRGIIRLPEVRYGEYATNYEVRGNDRISERSEVSVTMRFRDKVASKTLGQPLSLAAAAPTGASANAPAGAASAARASCTTCATVEAVNVVNLAGGAGQGPGGAVGNSNSGVTVTTGAGPGVSYRYDVSLRYADGRLVTMPFDSDPGLSAGEQVRVNDGVIVRDSAAF